MNGIIDDRKSYGVQQLWSCHHHCHRHARSSQNALSLFLLLSLSRFITSTIGTIDPMITAENIIVNAYDPLMTMDHSRCQIGNGSNGADCGRARARARARITAVRMRARELTHATPMTNAFNVDVNSRYDKSKFKGTARYRIKRVRARSVLRH